MEILSKFLFAAETTFCGAALVGLNLVVSWVEAELGRLNISSLGSIPRSLAPSQSFQRARSAYAQLAKFGCFAVMPKKVLKASRKILRETYNETFGRSSAIAKRSLLHLRRQYKRVFGFKGSKKYIFKYFIRSPAVALSLLCASLTFPPLLGCKFMSKPKHVMYGIMRAATFSAFCFVHPLHASHALLYSYSRTAKRFERFSKPTLAGVQAEREESRTEEEAVAPLCTEKDEMPMESAVTEGRWPPASPEKTLPETAPSRKTVERSSMVKVQVVEARKLTPSVTNRGFWAFGEPEKRFVEAYMKRLRSDGSEVCTMLGKTSTKVGTLDPSWEASEESFDFLYSQAEKYEFPNQTLKLFFKIRSENQPDSNPLATAELDVPRIVETRKVNATVQSSSANSGSFTEVGEEARFQRQECAILAPGDEEEGSGGRLIVDVWHQYSEAMEMEESEDGILIHSKTIL